MPQRDAKTTRADRVITQHKQSQNKELSGQKQYNSPGHALNEHSKTIKTWRVVLPTVLGEQEQQEKELKGLKVLIQLLHAEYLIYK